MLVQVVNGYDQNEVAALLIEQGIRETVQAAATGALRQGCPRSRILENATEAAFDFHRELQAQPFTLLLVVGDSLRELVIGGLEKVHLHTEYFCSIFSNTFDAGSAAMSPRS